MSAQGTIPYKLLMPERARSSGTIRLEAQSTLHQQSLMMSSISAFWTQRSILLKPRQGPYFGAAPLKTESARRLRLSMEWSMQARRITRSTRAMPPLTRSSGATPQGIALSPHPWGAHGFVYVGSNDHNLYAFNQIHISPRENSQNS